MKARACANATAYGKEDMTMGNAEANVITDYFKQTKRLGKGSAR